MLYEFNVYSTHSSVFISGIAILLCVCLHCVTSDNSNETSSTAFPIFNTATQEHALIKNISSLITTTTTTKVPIIEQVTTLINVPSPQTTVTTVAETSLPDDTLGNITKSNSTILSAVPVVNNNNDVTQSTNAENQEKDIDTTTQSTTVVIKQTDSSKKTTSVEQTLHTTTSTTQSTTIALPLSDKTTSSTQVSVTEKTLTTTTKSTESVDVCLKSHIIKLLPDSTLTGEEPSNSANQFSVNVTKGDITITVVSKRLTSAQFIVNRINELNLIRDNVTLGELLLTF